MLQEIKIIWVVWWRSWMLGIVIGPRPYYIIQINLGPLKISVKKK